MKDLEILKFVIVGHIDHGKSTLIGRLLYDTNSLPPDKIEEAKRTSQDLGGRTEFAYLLDYLEEERRQGITIDTTQVFFKTNKRAYVIIDAPGHVEFVKNMITGASQAEAAVLIIDANKGIEEQTRRHAYILALLGLDQIIVVLNKMDLVSFSKGRFDRLKQEAEEFLNSINIRPSIYLPLCAIDGKNIVERSRDLSWYKGPTFLESLDALKKKVSPKNKPLILPVQDVYKIEDKRIIVGRIEAGTIHQGELITVLPRGKQTRIRSIEKYPGQVDKASAGESIGIITEDPTLIIDRGDVICELGREPILTDTFQANIFWMSRDDLKRGQEVNLKCSTQQAICRVEKIIRRINSSTLEIIQEDADVLKNLEVGEVVIKTKIPLVITTFNDIQELGRFVLVQDRDICAGGIVTSLINKDVGISIPQEA